MAPETEDLMRADERDAGTVERDVVVLEQDEDQEPRRVARQRPPVRDRVAEQLRNARLPKHAAATSADGCRQSAVAMLGLAMKYEADPARIEAMVRLQNEIGALCTGGAAETTALTGARG